MSTALRLLDQATTHQDYLWFLAVLAWAGVAAGFGRRGEARLQPWLAAWAVANVFSAGIELALLSVHDRTDQYWIWDRLMSAALGASTGTLLWGAAAPWFGSRRRLAFLAATVAAAALTLARNAWPVAGGLAVALAAALALRALARVPRAAEKPDGAVPDLTAAMTVFVFWPLLATHGPLAHATGPGRIGEDYSRFALVAAGVLAAAGILAARSIWRARLPAPAEFAPNLHRHLRWLGIWLVAGFALMVLSGAIARREYEAGLRARVRTAAQALDPQLLMRAMGPELRTGTFEWRRAPSGTAVEVMLTPTAGRPEFVTLRDTLARLQAVNPDLRYAYLVTLRGQRVVSVMTGGNPQPTLPRLLVLRRAGPDDIAMLHRREAVIIGPTKDIFGERVSAQCPVHGPGGGPALGWLVFDVASSRWLAVFAQARLQTMGIVAVGVLLWAMVLANDRRRLFSEAAARRAAAAIEADRLKSAFLATVSHELRTPIQSVLGYAELLAGEKLPPGAAQWVAALRSHGQTMHQLVNDLIDTGALQSGVFRLHPRPAALRGIVEDAVAAVRPAALGKGLHLHWEFDEALPATVRCDAVRVRQILLNLLANAVKFTAAGEVRLRARVAPGPAGGVEFTVSDTGPGIPPEHRASLFQPFARLGAADGVEGTGLGLALVARLSASMGGGVRYDDGATGATFVVTLPLPDAESGRTPAPSEADAASVAWEGLEVLVAEDNALVRELLAAFLRRHGAHVTAVPDGEAALAAARRQPFAVVLLDWMMPGVDGLSAARALRAQAPSGQPPFIIGLSAHAGGAALAEAHAAGMNVFLAKPVDLATLAHTIAQVPGVKPLPHLRLAGDAALFATLQARFSLELPGLVDDLAASARARDWPRLRARTHYLKNSADLVGARALGAACQRVLDRDARPDDTEFDALTAHLAAIARQPFAPSDESNP